MRFWLCLVLSALLQVGWLICLPEMQGFTRFGPMFLYAFFGFTSAFFLSRSLQGIPMSTAYAVWTGISVLGSVLVDGVVFKGFSPGRLACILLILAGTTGLKLAEEAPKTTVVISRTPPAP